MSVFGEFHVPSNAFALHETLNAVSEMVIEIERVVATEEVLTPYFWVSEVNFGTFEDAVAKDPSIRNLEQLDEFQETALYRAEWTRHVESIVYIYTEIEAVVLEATGSNERWELRIRFDDRDELDTFQRYCHERNIAFDLRRLYDLSQPKTGGQYGLTSKQQSALVAAWEAGYFETPREASLEDVAAELDITQQSLSKRLHRAHRSLIANTLIVSASEPSQPT
ncbi:helix-turn-helix domain-containing protein [Halostagnicola kamekurae]|uniref:GAF and HTH_10 associated domain-containing protein n=1 Tax=Halostagnicola kamekurae TaxID=619731 RepID=A0A1I6PR29_9EURY|nr:helix-turn-helix domain-containing protein [Halostagnicola kamekurae]SFS42495.1 GAF and HTH_10 associated domain-containing protein [Halostagnicola kamekurae]